MIATAVKVKWTGYVVIEGSADAKEAKEIIQEALSDAFPMRSRGGEIEVTIEAKGVEMGPLDEVQRGVHVKARSR
jgi:hypothetical protein